MRSNYFLYFKKNRVNLLVVSVGGLLLGFGSSLFLGQLGFGELSSKKILSLAALFILFTGLIASSSVAFAMLGRLNRQQAWLIDATNWNIKRLESNRNIESKLGQEVDEKATTEVRWPWGNHHTEALGHLEAAAKKLWTLYDPNDFSTAPTNDMVAEWLQSERGVSRERARAIASMLRPDGLPTGPRR